MVEIGPLVIHNPVLFFVGEGVALVILVVSLVLIIKSHRKWKRRIEEMRKRCGS